MQNQQAREPTATKEAASILKVFSKLPDTAKAYIEGFGAGVLQSQGEKKPEKTNQTA